MGSVENWEVNRKVEWAPAGERVVSLCGWIESGRAKQFIKCWVGDDIAGDSMHVIRPQGRRRC